MLGDGSTGLGGDTTAGLVGYATTGFAGDPTIIQETSSLMAPLDSGPSTLGGGTLGSWNTQQLVVELVRSTPLVPVG